MGHKVNPTGFRLGVIRDWQAKWYTDKHYANFLMEDLKLRQSIREKYGEAAISLIGVERQANQVSVTIHTARPGIVIGRGGQRVDEMRTFLEKLIGRKIQLNIREIQQAELDAYLVARSIAEQIERRVAFRRAMKQSVLRTMQAGAKGVKVSCSGRLGGAEIARRLSMHEGRVPLHTLRADIDYGFTEARTTMGRIGVKVWIYKGDVLPEFKEAEEAGGEAVVTETVIVTTGTQGAPVVEAESKPAIASIIKEEAAEAPVVAEERPAKPAIRRRVAKPAASPVEETVAEKEETPQAEIAPAEPEEKPAKPTARKPAKSAPVAEEKLAETAEPAMPPSEVEEPPSRPAAKKKVVKEKPSPKPEET